MPENGHDRLDTRTALGELGADGVPKPVRSYGRLAVGIDESGSRASGFERALEHVPATDRLTAVNEHPVDAATYPAIVVRGGGSRLSVLDQLAQRVGRLWMERDHALGVGLADWNA
jgi:hypothetical protein